VFRSGRDDEFLAVFAAVTAGSLDDATRRGIAAHGVEGQARDDLECYLGMPGDRGWWRLAETAAGELIGFVVPSANAGGPVVGYLGVLPAHRGRGFVDDLLAEATRILVGAGATRIVADTDAANAPMAQAFDRAGYRGFAVRLVISPPG
jgi:RimJ/RimL family protein N-acetyltransferase